MRQQQPGFMHRKTFKRACNRRLRRDQTSLIEGLMEVVADYIEMLDRRRGV